LIGAPKLNIKLASAPKFDKEEKTEMVLEVRL